MQFTEIDVNIKRMNLQLNNDCLWKEENREKSRHSGELCTYMSIYMYIVRLCTYITWIKIKRTNDVILKN